MKKIKNNLHRFAIVLSIIVMASCSLDEYNPSGALPDNVWKTPEGFVTVVNAAYGEQRNWYGKEDGIFMSESGTDLWFNRDKNTYSSALSQYSPLSGNDGSFHKSAWGYLYKAINLCNAGINRIEDAGFTDEGEKTKRLAELHFLRGYYYWHIVETWGNVILRTTEVSEPELTAERSSVEEFYDLIISDLQFAVDNLPIEWTNGEYSRATRKAAMGFLARAYLSRAYYGDATNYFTKARDMAQQVIDNATTLKTSLWPTYAEVWDPKNNKSQMGKEALYVVSNSSNFALNQDDNGNKLYQVLQAPYAGKPGLVASLTYGYENSRRLMATRTMLELFDETIDSRYDVSFQERWIANTAYTWNPGDATSYGKDAGVVGTPVVAGQDLAMLITKQVVANKSTLPYVVYDINDMYAANDTIKTGNNYINFKKFQDPDRASASSQPGYKDVIVMRFAEMYMIVAEAEFGLGHYDLAAASINVLRTRAALPGQEAAMQVSDTDITRDFILDEYAREFAGEHKRWFDLKRMLGGNDGQDFADYIKARNPNIKAVQYYHRVRPVSQDELNALINADEFGQNEGYN